MTLMRKAPPVDYPFQEKSKFALLTLNNVYTDLPAEACQLPNGTWTMPGLPVPDLGIWKEWLGSIRLKRLGGANLVLFVEEPSDNPRSLDNVHQRLTKDLSWLFQMLHLRAGIEADSADLLCGSSVNGVPEIRQMSQMPTFYQSTGYTRAPITRSWIEDGLLLREGAAAMEADKKQFRRVIRGLNTLFKGLKETGQDRLHQFVRSLEALVLPDIGKTSKQFAHRCQTFSRAGSDTRELLLETYAMRCATEHLNLGTQRCSSAIRWTSVRPCPGTGHGKSRVWLVMHTHGSCATRLSVSISGQRTKWQRSGSCQLPRGAGFGALPSTSRKSPSFRSTTDGGGPARNNRSPLLPCPGASSPRYSSRRRWRKLHLELDLTSGGIVCAHPDGGNVHLPERVVPALDGPTGSPPFRSGII